MNRVILFEFTSTTSCQGFALLLARGSTAAAPVEITNSQALAELANSNDCSCIITLGAERGTEAWDSLEWNWQGRSTSLWHSTDLAYCLGLATPESLDGLIALAEQALDTLQSLADDVLAHICLLAQERQLDNELEFFFNELHRRHDALSIPAAGQVDPEEFFPDKPAEKEGGRQELPPDILASVFKARSALRDAFEHYEERPQQQAMVHAVEQAIENKFNLIVEAGTGVGKSLGYLLPLAVHSARTGELCLVSTNTINLQQQLISQDLPRVRKLLEMLELTVTLLKGREHYLCIKRLQETWLRASATLRDQLLDKKHSRAILPIIRLLAAGTAPEDGDLDVIPSAPNSALREHRDVLGSVDCRFQTCLGEKCQYKPECHYFRQRSRALASHIVITNHALVFAQFNPSDRDRDNVVSRARVIVFDEAHNVEGVITDQNTLEINNHKAVDVGNRLLAVLQHEALRRRLELDSGHVEEQYRDSLRRCQYQGPQVGAWIRAAVETGNQVDRLLEQAAERGHIESDSNSTLTPATATPGQQHLMEWLGRLAERLATVIDQMQQLIAEIKMLVGDEESSLYVNDDTLQMEIQSLQLDLLECSAALGRWDPDDTAAITWFNALSRYAEPGWEFKTAPLDAGPVFQSLITSKDCVILSSATLTVAGSFDYIKSSLGFDDELTSQESEAIAEKLASLDLNLIQVGRAGGLVLDSPFDYAAQSMLLIPTNLARPTGPTRDSYLGQLEEVVYGACGIVERGVLVLFNSYRDLNHIADKLAPLLPPGRLLIQGVSGSREELANRFRDTGTSVLLATRSFWEGFDVSGDALSCVILAKLPFANFKDPIHAGRQRAIDATNGDSFREYSLPLAAMLLKQGFGRLIRSTTDRGCVFLLDSRVLNANYGRVFLKSLPGPGIYSGSHEDCLSQATQFMEHSGGNDA